MAYWSYCLVIVWFVGQFQRGKDFLFRRAPWYPKRNITFSDMLAAARRSRLSQPFLVERGTQQDRPKFTYARSLRRPDCQERARL